MSVVAARSRDFDPRRWSADRFLDFYKTRPEGERWQLVDGIATMMVPPSKVHQRIADNLLRLLDARLQEAHPEMLGYRETGVRIPDVSDFHPEPDVAVLLADATYSYYDDRFFLVAEVVSPSNTAEMIDRKVALYKTHPDNLYCIVVDQDSVHVTLHAREGEAWASTELYSLDNVLRLPAFGFEARLQDIYKGTPLAR
jgi:Uma2 family endonuclease